MRFFRKTVSPRKAEGRRGLSLFSRFRSDEKGAYAIEFALVAIPFLALLFAVIETALVFFADSILNNASAQAARLIRTGQAQSSSMSADAFKTQICDAIAVPMFKCSKLHVDVETYQQFSEMNLNKPLDADGNLEDNFDFKPGKGGDIVVVRVFYEWPIVVNSFGLHLADMANGNRLLSAVFAFRNEPFPW